MSQSAFSDYLKVLPQYILPHHALSGIMHRLTRIRIKWLKNLAIKTIVKKFNVDLSIAEREQIADYVSFNDFFTRALKPGARSIETGIVSPVDGTVSQSKAIDSDRIFQAKGHDYSLLTLLGGDEKLAAEFDQGDFSTIYLSPRDYHRIHAPVQGTLRQMIHVPGRLFSVSPATTRRVAGLFARNERVVCIFDTDVGPVAVVMVGAIFVGSIETVWAGEVTPPTQSSIQRWDYSGKEMHFEAGQEIGRFNMGSTVILVFGENAISGLTQLQPEQSLIMGQTIAQPAHSN